MQSIEAKDHVWTGHAPFHSNEFVLPGSLGGQPRCFSAVLRLYSPLGKAFTTSFQPRFTRILNRHVLCTYQCTAPPPPSGDSGAMVGIWLSRISNAQWWGRLSVSNPRVSPIQAPRSMMGIWHGKIFFMRFFFQIPHSGAMLLVKCPMVGWNFHVKSPTIAPLKPEGGVGWWGNILIGALPKVHQPIILMQALYSLYFSYTGCF